jgi:extracellular elastinolytic metalloproteinase
MARRVASAVVALVLVVASAVVAEAAGAAQERSTARQQSSGDPVGLDFQGEDGGRADIDNREGEVAPPAARQRGAPSAPASAETVRFNRFGTAEMVTTSTTGGVLASGLSTDAVEAARQWIAMRPDLYGLTAEDAAGLEVLRNSPLGLGRSVLLRQKWGDLPAGIDGLIGVGVVNGSVVQAFGSSTRDTQLTGTLQLTAAEAVRQAVGGNPTVTVIGT